MADELTYMHSCSEHGCWTDHEQYSFCPRCGSPHLEEIPEEVWDAILNAPEPPEADPAFWPPEEPEEEVQP